LNVKQLCVIASASEAIQDNQKLDCFVAAAPRNDVLTQDTTSPSRGRKSARVMHQRCPSKRRGRRECRVLAAPAASRVEKNTRVSHHRYAETFRHSPRDGFNASFVLSLVIGLFCHHRRQIVLPT
jgi:hypothetical protein